MSAPTLFAPSVRPASPTAHAGHYDAERNHPVVLGPYRPNLVWRWDTSKRPFGVLCPSCGAGKPFPQSMHGFPPLRGRPPVGSTCPCGVAHPFQRQPQSPEAVSDSRPVGHLVAPEPEAPPTGSQPSLNTLLSEVSSA